MFQMILVIMMSQTTVFYNKFGSVRDGGFTFSQNFKCTLPPQQVKKSSALWVAVRGALYAHGKVHLPGMALA